MLMSKETSRDTLRIVVKTTGREDGREHGSVLGLKSLGFHHPMASSRAFPRTVVKTTDREVDRGVCSKLWGIFGLWLRLFPLALALAITTLNRILNGLLNYGV
uniref:Uncharacterized protein n=1 Tax=Solanum tuberosum TaxID=4113 RepID=M1DXF7_SOLTU